MPLVDDWRMGLKVWRRAASGRALAPGAPCFSHTAPREITAATPSICGCASVVSCTSVLSSQSLGWLSRAPTGIGVAGAPKVSAVLKMLQIVLMVSMPAAAAGAAAEGGGVDAFDDAASFEVGEKVLAFDRAVLYEAKVWARARARGRRVRAARVQIARGRS